MTQPVENSLAAKELSRRQVLRFLAGVPVLPLAAGSSTMLLTGCDDDDDDDVKVVSSTTTPNNTLYNAPKTVKSVEFVGMDAPTNVAEMATTTVNSKLQATMTDGTSKSYKLVYNKVFNTGESVPSTTGGNIISGGYFDINGNPIYDTSVDGQKRQFFSDCPDGTSMLTINGAKPAGVAGNAVFAVVQFEYTTKNLAGDSMYGKLPSPIAVLTFDQDPNTGALRFVRYHNVDTSPAKGLWITCGASLSPWNTHLSSEEYEPDGLISINGNASDKQFAAYSKNLFGDENTAYVYNYGHLPEITVNADGTGTCKKHYCLGRLSHELVQVMPDQKTVLMGNDSTNAGIFMFIADNAKDLSAGTLYAAKINQRSPAGDKLGDFGVQWIKLGHATSAEIQGMVTNKIKISDFMDVQLKDPKDSTYTKIKYNGKDNWVKLTSNSEFALKAAAFLETLSLIHI